MSAHIKKSHLGDETVDVMPWVAGVFVAAFLGVFFYGWLLHEGIVPFSAMGLMLVRVTFALLKHVGLVAAVAVAVYAVYQWASGRPALMLVILAIVLVIGWAYAALVLELLAPLNPGPKSTDFLGGV